MAAAAAIDIFIPILRFLLCFVVTIPAILSWRVVPVAVPRHLYAAFSEADRGHGLRRRAPHPPLRRRHHLLHWLRLSHRMIRAPSINRPLPSPLRSSCNRFTSLY
nr:PREDICTED: uncharacterized protein LOC103994019 [Musa acuminata subsp. malaccensis]